MAEPNKNGFYPLPPVDEIKFSPRAKRWTVVIIAGLLIIFLLHVAEVLPPFIWAGVTAFLFNGLVNRLTARFNRPRWVWALTIYLIFLVVLIISLFLLIPALSAEARSLATEAPSLKKSVDQYLIDNPTITIAGITFQSDSLRDSINGVIDRIPGIAQEFGPRLLSGTLRFLIDFLLYLITTFYLMLMGGRAIWGFIDSLPLQYRQEIRSLVTRAYNVLSAYVRGQVLLVLIMAAAASIILSVLGVRYSLLLGIATGILELVPFVGPYLAIATSCTVAFFQPHGPNHSFGMDAVTLTIVVGVALFVLRQLEDYVVIPNLIGRILELPPLLIIFSTITGAALLGPMGLLLAVPIVAVLKIIVAYLFYKLVDADRQKIFLPSGTEPEGLYNVLQSQPARARLLVIPNGSSVSLEDQETLERVREISFHKALDVAFYCGEDEELAEQVKKSGFPVVTMEQEDFAGQAMQKA
ncbi:MAG TPA: AI-2E family transporter [Chloroflexia bacterium]|nr:AI-2E family transporter [Chloroflexia bacterium]